MKNNMILVILALAAIITPGLAQDVTVIAPAEREVVVVTPIVEDQKDSREKFHFGVKGGYNFANVYDTEGEEFDAKPKFGVAAGIFLSIPIGRYIGIQPEALYSQRGFKGTGTLLGSSYRMTRTTSYVDFPLLLAIKPANFLTLLAGPQFAYTLSRRDVFSNSGATVQQQEEFDNDNIRKNTLSFLSGMDFNIDHVVLGVRAGWDLQNNNGDGSSTTPRYKNMWVQATLGFRI